MASIKAYCKNKNPFGLYRTSSLPMLHLVLITGTVSLKIKSLIYTQFYSFHLSRHYVSSDKQFIYKLF